MPASRTDEVVRRFSPEPLVCWCNGQSLESRYSSSVTSGGQAAGGAVLRHQLAWARLEDAVPMARFPVVAVSATRIYLFSGPVPHQEAFAVLSRVKVRVIHGGNAMWRRLDILAAVIAAEAVDRLGFEARTRRAVCGMSVRQPQ